ncbi:MAG: ChbG/HpnK family deacetylase, partial [Magnetococcus sp. YQC-5]
MNIRMHADDLGLSPALSAHILGIHDAGALDSASMVVNYPGFMEVVQAVLERPKLRTVLHLNIFEGKPVASPERVALLLNAQGRFRFQFVDLWRTYLRANTEERQALGKAVECEFEAQILHYRNAFPSLESLEVDSHVHFHMIPFVFDLLLSLAKRHPIRRIRTTREPFFFAREGGWSAFGPNLLKHLLLKWLTRRQADRLSAAGIETNDYLIGILHSGHMNFAAVTTGLASLVDKDPQEVEILFHPGCASQEEAANWPGRPEIFAFHSSPWRQQETEVLHRVALSGLLAQYRSPAAIGTLQVKSQ